MPSAFDLQFAESGAPALLAQFGQTVTYTPAGGTAVALTAIVHAEEERESEHPDGRRLTRTRQVDFSSDADSPDGGVAAVKLFDTLTIGGVTYAVHAVLAKTHAMTSVETIRTEDLQRSGDGYRRRGR